MEKVLKVSSPNFDARRLPVTMLVLHYTGMQTVEAALAWLCNPASKVSAHYLIDEEGNVHCLVAEAHRAWHAGKSYWRGIEDVNSASIGIEIANPGHEFGYRAFLPAQLTALILLAHELITRYRIHPWNIVGHSDVAPTRKTDPGELFPWEHLAREGVGWWPPEETGQGVALSKQVKDILQDIGYNPKEYEASPSTVLMAFQRRFLPFHLSGEVDEVTLKRLSSVETFLQKKGLCKAK